MIWCAVVSDINSFDFFSFSLANNNSISVSFLFSLRLSKWICVTGAPTSTKTEVTTTTNERTNERTNEQTNEQTDKRKKRKNKQMNIQTNIQTNERKNGSAHLRRVFIRFLQKIKRISCWRNSHLSTVFVSHFTSFAILFSEETVTLFLERGSLSGSGEI